MHETELSQLRQARTRNIRIDYARATISSFMCRHPLPPGSMKCKLDKLEAADRLSLIEISKKNGPIFKGKAWGGLWIYVVGLPLCRKIIEDHEDDLNPVTLDTTSLFAAGLLRQMEGDDHRKYRTQLV